MFIRADKSVPTIIDMKKIIINLKYQFDVSETFFHEKKTIQ